MGKAENDKCRGNIKRYSFPQRTIEIWDNFDSDPAPVKSVDEFRAKITVDMKRGRNEHSTFPVCHR